MKKFVWWFAIWFLSSQQSYASGFSILELGGRAAGMGGAFAAVADDGSALFYNPAGISFQRGTRFEMDGFVVKGISHFFPTATPRGTIVPEEGYNGIVSPKVQFLGNMYMTKELSSRWTAGFGMYSPNGLGDNWTNFNDSDPPGEKFVGRYAGNRGRMENIWLQPTLSYKLTDNSSFAIGPALVYLHIMLEQSILNPLDDAKVFGEALAPLILPDQDPVLAGRSIARLLPEGRARFAAKDFAPGISFGYLYKHTASKTNLGAMWRSPVTFHLKGDASFAFTDDYPLRAFVGADTIPNLFPKQAIKGAFTTPYTWAVGVANSAYWGSTFAVDLLFQNYARFKDIPINFTQTEGTATPPEVRFQFDFQNAFFLRTGWEKRLTEKTIVRAGYYYDKSAVPEKSVGPFFPDSSKHVGTVGASWQIGNKEISFFYQGAKLLARDVQVPENANLWTNGTYKTFFHLFGFGFRMRMGGETIRTD
ncbi:MAG: outer membrane protein transport protein [Acidobacteria bacterium]|nr:outer membrane protein transport protein [Acidobacteriota bacterium]